jgi:Leucine rich repeat
VGTSFGNALNKLDLSGNRLDYIPTQLIQNLPILQTLDLSHCALNRLPDKWHLPKLTKLNFTPKLIDEFSQRSTYPPKCRLVSFLAPNDSITRFGGTEYARGNTSP